MLDEIINERNKAQADIDEQKLMLQQQQLKQLQQQQQQQQRQEQIQQAKKRSPSLSESTNHTNYSNYKKTLDACIQTNHSETPSSSQFERYHDIRSLSSQAANVMPNHRSKTRYQVPPAAEMISRSPSNYNDADIDENEFEEYVETSLICTIPEHHNLEDIVHQNREQIANLKDYIHNIKLSSNMDDIALLEKKAEIEALDLAINDRKAQLLNMELARNRKLYGKTYTNTSNDTESSENSRRESASQVSTEVIFYSNLK